MGRHRFSSAAFEAIQGRQTRLWVVPNAVQENWARRHIEKPVHFETVPFRYRDVVGLRTETKESALDDVVEHLVKEVLDALTFYFKVFSE